MANKVKFREGDTVKVTFVTKVTNVHENTWGHNIELATGDYFDINDTSTYDEFNMELVERGGPQGVGTMIVFDNDSRIYVRNEAGNWIDLKENLIYESGDLFDTDVTYEIIYEGDDADL